MAIDNNHMLDISMFSQLFVPEYFGKDRLTARLIPTFYSKYWTEFYQQEMLMMLGALNSELE